MARWELGKFDECLDLAGIKDTRLRKSYRACFKLALKTDWTMAMAGAFLPPHRRPAMAAVGAVVRWVDDLADHRKGNVARFSEETQELLAEVRSGHSAHPVRAAIVHSIGAFALPVASLERFVATTRADIGRTEFATEAELSEFARHAVGAPVLLGCPLLGGPVDDPAFDQAVLSFGEGLDRVDNLRDLSEDLARGWLGISRETLDNCAADPTDLMNRRATPEVLRALRCEADRAAALLAGADMVVAGLPAYGKAAIDTMQSLYRLHLDTVTEDLPAVLRRRPRPRTASLKRLAVSSLGSMAGAVPQPRTETAPLCLPIAAPHAPEQSDNVRHWASHRAISAELRRCCEQSQDGVLAAIQSHALLPVGKLLRPVLTVEGAGAVGGDTAVVVQAAVSTELVHVASLINDDIIDGDDRRRGRDSAPARFGADFAILAANGLFMKALQALSRCREQGVTAERLNQAFNDAGQTGQDLTRGVALELSITDDLTCPVDTYLEMIKLKTAVLFAYASRLGAYLVDGGNDQVKALSAYGLALGMAFQIRDDLLPYDSTSEAAGKDASSDLRNHRPTLPILLAYAHATPHQQDELHALWNDTDHERALSALHRVLQGTQAVVRARNLATTYGEQAQSHLDRLPDTPHRTRLRYLVRQATQRIN
ncbi:polyprenyl synthetase family protein [Streptomyces sp. WM6378]|uniref:polyprenyl synthetase family protein n=1 Tax=Streptomyces sp. WM6378 TaxID=1415557 RepID=UPI000A78F6C1|nr:polyprenyl synthetase family protein [Streptomyces sp. WM6378]